jgi:Ulp1 protease family, C-terminal catalytic domain
MNTKIQTKTPAAAKVCSPLAERRFDGTCFTKEALAKIATIWNKNYGNANANGNASGNKPILNISGKTKDQLWNDIHKRMLSQCKDSEACWVDTLGQEARSVNEIADSLRPLKPREWKKKPYAWLSNYDIQAVMRQYQKIPEYKYKFLGVFPIDFEKKTEFGTCVSEEICKLDLGALYKKGIRYVGMITNLDRHDEPGSHWTSLFICLDPNAKCYGAYYYDSTFTKNDTPPVEITEFINKIKAQLVAINGPQTANTFRIDYNKNKHQYKNTECGVFSMVFQIRWLRKLIKDPNTVFETIVGIKMNDDDIHQIREVLFRENTKV